MSSAERITARRNVAKAAISLSSPSARNVPAFTAARSISGSSVINSLVHRRNSTTSFALFVTDALWGIFGDLTHKLDV